MSADSAARWEGLLPSRLVARVDDIHAAAIHLAYAARPAGTTSAAVDYWRTLPANAQLEHFNRATLATGQALGISRPGRRCGSPG